MYERRGQRLDDPTRLWIICGCGMTKRSGDEGADDGVGWGEREGRM